MSPKEVIQEWVNRFNKADVDGLIAMYHPDAINHQVVTEPLVKFQRGYFDQLTFFRIQGLPVPDHYLQEY